MNHVFAQAAGALDNVWVMAITTVIFLALFIAWTAWAYSSGNRERMERAARMPLAEDDA